MKAIIIFCLLLIVAASSRSQQLQSDSTHPVSWEPINIGASGIGLTGFAHDDTCYASGVDNLTASATLFKTFDGGQHWSSLPLPGLGWEMFLDASTGICVVGDTAFRTTDFGVTWYPHYSVVDRAKCVTHVGPDTLFIAGSGVCARSTDRGETWVGEQFDGDANGIAFLEGFGGQVGYAMGDPLPWVGAAPPAKGTLGANFLLTHYGGDYWKPVWSGIEHDAIDALVELSSGTLIAASGHGRFYRTTDEGRHWDTTPELRTPSAFNAISFSDTLHGCAVGPYGIIEWTDDGGVTWRDVSFPGSQEFRSVKVVDSATAYVSGGSLLLKTTNAGLSWVAPELTTPNARLVLVYPNPSSGTVSFAYELSEPNSVTIQIFNMQGLEVASSVASEVETTGEHTLTLNLSTLTSGVYAFRLSAGSVNRFGSFTISR